MESRRRIRRRNHTLLPLSRARQLSNTVSCWYCDIKFSALNEPLFRFGRRHSRFLRVWFGMGVGFSLAAVVGVTIVIVCELVQALLFYAGHGRTRDSLFGISSLIGRQNISLFSLGYLCLSSVLSLLVHEFGHAIAAASEGVQMEYVAIFWAILFPGALVAFNDALFATLPRAASLRIYCAGIWHNAVFCAVCTLVLLLLPFLLGPFYVYGGSPMVLNIPHVSPLSGYLLPRDVIISVDGVRVDSEEDWKHVLMALSNEQARSEYGGMLNVEKGYCIPHSVVDEGIQAVLKGNQTYCPSELSAFAFTPCLGTNGYASGSRENYLPRGRESTRCLDPKEVVKLKKCTRSSFPAPRNKSRCLCSEVESCWTPLEQSDLRWVEIKYAALECYYSTWRSPLSDIKEQANNSTEGSCIQSFVFLGDMTSAAHSIRLTSYKPRAIYFPAYLPNLLEEFLIYSFNVSLMLALTNSLPVYFLDGESIVEVILTYLCPSKKAPVLRWCLVSGTILSVSFILHFFTFLFLR